MVLRKRDVCLIIHCHRKKEKHWARLSFLLFNFFLIIFQKKKEEKEEGGGDEEEEEENYTLDVTRGSYIIFDVYLFNSYTPLKLQ